MRFITLKQEMEFHMMFSFCLIWTLWFAFKISNTSMHVQSTD